MTLKTFLLTHGISNGEAARALSVDKRQLTRWCNDVEAQLKQRNVDKILAYLSHRLGRPVTAAEVWGAVPWRG